MRNHICDEARSDAPGLVTSRPQPVLEQLNEPSAVLLDQAELLRALGVGARRGVGEPLAGDRDRGRLVARLVDLVDREVLHARLAVRAGLGLRGSVLELSLIHISEPTRLGMISYAVFCLKK